MRQNRVQEEWLEFRKATIPKEVGVVQLQETRRAFYGGAHALLCRIMKSLEAGEEPTEQDLNMMIEIRAELDDFYKAVKEGRA